MGNKELYLLYRMRQRVGGGKVLSADVCGAALRQADEASGPMW